jgi:flotillin
MGSEILIFLIVPIAMLVVISVTLLSVWGRFYTKPAPDEAIIRSGQGGPTVATGWGIWIFPVLHRADVLDLSMKRIEIVRRGDEALVCRDGERADVTVAFLMRVNHTRDDILHVARTVGCGRIGDPQALFELFGPKFSLALTKAARQFDFAELDDERERFREAVLRITGTETDGFVVDAVVESVTRGPDEHQHRLVPGEKSQARSAGLDS